jgi:hypothetical protein
LEKTGHSGQNTAENDLLRGFRCLVLLIRRFPHQNNPLPVGISFYTFQTMRYTIDVYRGKMKPERNLGIFALYVSFFPQLGAAFFACISLPPVCEIGFMNPNHLNRTGAQKNNQFLAPYLAEKIRHQLYSGKLPHCPELN